MNINFCVRGENLTPEEINKRLSKKGDFLNERFVPADTFKALDSALSEKSFRVIWAPTIKPGYSVDYGTLFIQRVQ